MGIAVKFLKKSVETRIGKKFPTGLRSRAKTPATFFSRLTGCQEKKKNPGNKQGPLRLRLSEECSRTAAADRTRMSIKLGAKKKKQHQKKKIPMPRRRQPKEQSSSH